MKRLSLWKRNRDGKREYRFFSSILFVFGLLGVFAIAATLAYSLHVGQRSIDAEIEQGLNQRHLSLKSILENRLNIMDVYFQAMLTSYLLSGMQVQEDGGRALDDIIFSFRDSNARQLTDLFFMTDSYQQLLLDASSGVYPVSDLLASLQDPLVYTGGWRLVRLSEGSALLKAFPIFQPGTLILEGYVFGGLVISHNPVFKNYLFERMDIDFIGLFEQAGVDFLRLEMSERESRLTGREIFSIHGQAEVSEADLLGLSTEDTQLTPSGVYVNKRFLEIEGLADDGLTVYLGVDAGRFNRLSQSFWPIFALTGGGFLLFLSLAILIFRVTHKKATANLMNYISLVRKERHVQAYKPTRIYEYNRVGEALQSMVEEIKVVGRVFESSVEGMLITDARQRILRANDAFTSMTGYTQHEISGLSVKEAMANMGINIGVETSVNVNDAIEQHVAAEQSWTGHLTAYARDGRAFHLWMNVAAVYSDEEKRLLNYVYTFFDVTEKIEAERKIHHLAYFDQLTMLPNRQFLLKRLKEATAGHGEHSGLFALLYIDIDDFKTLNDANGHDAGDQVLVKVAERLNNAVSQALCVARVGGDEFMVLLNLSGDNELAAKEKLQHLVLAINSALTKPYEFELLSYSAALSVGATLFSAGSKSVELILQEVDLALHQAKSDGRNSYRTYVDSMLEQVVKRVELTQSLRRAVKNREFVLFYQPQVGRHGELLGSEALIRWNHPQLGWVSPADFIPLAEESGIIVELGDWVLSEACSQLCQWSKAPDTRHLSVSVNISVRQFKASDFVEKIQHLVASTGIHTSQLKLEITESLLVDDENIKETTKKMVALRDMGFVFSLDDFGTGYSSLSYLKKLPIDELKIDKSFVDDLLLGKRGCDIAHTIITLGESLNLSVIAEGVESQAQCEKLKELGCYAYQGFFFSKPLPVSAFNEQVSAFTRVNVSSV